MDIKKLDKVIKKITKPYDDLFKRQYEVDVGENFTTTEHCKGDAITLNGPDFVKKTYNDYEVIKRIVIKKEDSDDHDFISKIIFELAYFMRHKMGCYTLTFEYSDREHVRFTESNDYEIRVFGYKKRGL